MAIVHDIELVWITEASSKAIENWYNILLQIIDCLSILWQNTYNYDETGFTIEKGKAIWAMIDIKVGQKYKAELGHQE